MKPHVTKGALIGVSVFVWASVLALIMRQGQICEPTYDGKRLSVWLQQATRMTASSVGADRGLDLTGSPADAIRHIGNKAVPVLLEMAGARESFLRHRLIATVRLYRLYPWSGLFADEYHERARTGFRALGAAGRQAVPTLVMWLQDPDQQRAALAAELLGLIGPEAAPAIPVLVHAYRESSTGSVAQITWQRIKRTKCIYALGAIHQSPDVVLPVLFEALSETNKIASTVAAYALTGFDTNGLMVIPQRRQAAWTTDKTDMRFSAVEALTETDADASCDVMLPTLEAVVTNGSLLPFGRTKALQDLSRLGIRGEKSDVRQSNPRHPAPSGTGR